MKGGLSGRKNLDDSSNSGADSDDVDSSDDELTSVKDQNIIMNRMLHHSGIGGIGGGHSPTTPTAQSTNNSTNPFYHTHHAASQSFKFGLSPLASHHHQPFDHSSHPTTHPALSSSHLSSSHLSSSHLSSSHLSSSHLSSSGLVMGHHTAAEQAMMNHLSAVAAASGIDYSTALAASHHQTNL